MRKRLLSFVLAVLMIASLLPATALAAEAAASGTCGAEGDGSNLTWTLDSEGTLTISGTGAMENYISDDAPWTAQDVKTVVIDNGVTSIGGFAFDGCHNLKNVTISDSVTKIREYAFSGCTALTGITIPSGVTSMNRAFENCTALTTVTLPDSVEEVIGTFAGCTALTNIKLPRNVAFIEGAFAGCTSLTDIAVAEENPYYCAMSGIVYSKDQKMIVAYPAGRPDTAFAIPEGVTGIGNDAFSGCTNLTQVSIPESVTGIGNDAFSECTNLTQVSVPEGVTKIEYQTFYSCESLESVTIPDAITDIGDNAFLNCDSLKDVYFLGTKDAWQKVSIESGNEAITEKATMHYFGEWTREKEPTCTETGSETSTCSEADCGKTFTREIPALGHAWDIRNVIKPATPEEDGTVTYTCTRCGEKRTETLKIVGSGTCGAEGDGSNLTWMLDNEGTLTISGTGDMARLGNQLWRDQKVKKAVIANGVTSIGEYAFSDCTYLESVTIPNSVTSIGNWAFNGCSSLTNVTIPDGVTRIADDAFRGCTSLASVTIPSNVKDIYSGAFLGCVALKEVNYLDSKEAFHTISIGEYSKAILLAATIHYFAQWDMEKQPTCTEAGHGTSQCSEDGCTKTYSREFPALGHAWDIRNVIKPATPEEDGTVTYTCTRCGEKRTETLKIVGSGTCGAEGDGSNLTWMLDNEGTLTISGTGDMARLGNQLWRDQKVKKAVIANGVTSIGEYAFSDCTYLESVTIPNSVTSIGNWAFNGCKSMTSVVISGSVLSIGYSAFSDCDKLADVTISDGVKKLGKRAFAGCDALTSLEIPASVEEMSGAIAACENLTTISVAPENAYYCVQDGVVYSKDGKDLVVYPQIGETSVVVPDGVLSIEDYAFACHENLGHVQLPDGIINIGNYAFHNCSKLTNVTIPDSITNIGSGAFEETALTSLQLPNGATNLFIRDDAFYGCDKLASVVIPEGVTSIGARAFYGTGLKNVTIPDSVADLGQSIFANCTNLESVTLSGNTPYLNGAFYGCVSLKEVNYFGSKDEFDKIAWDEADRDALKNATVHYFEQWTVETQPTCTTPGYGTSQCTEDGCTKTYTGEISALGHAWDDGVVNKAATMTEYGDKTYTCTRCGAQKTQVLKALYSGTCGAEGDGSNVTWTLDNAGTLTISGTGAMYSYWNTGIVGFNTPWRYLWVKHVIIQDGVTSIGSYAFIYNHTIESVEISGTVQTIEGNAFQGTHLKSVTIPDNVTSIGREAFQDCTSLKNIALSNGVQDLGYVFGGCTALESVTIPSGVTSMGSTFEGCTSLKNITFLGGVTSIKGAFRNCTALTTVTLPDGIEDITNAFEGCTALTNVTLPDSVEDISSAFSGCTALADITIPRNLKTINGAFAGCASLTDIAVAEENPYFCTMSGIVYSKDQKTIAAYPAGRPDTAFAIPEGTTGIGNGAFYGCTNLTQVTIPEGVTSIGDRAFYTCTGLTEITIPEGVTSIGDCAFAGYSTYDKNHTQHTVNMNLTSVSLPNSLTSIGGGAFQYCTKLESVVIPDGVTDIERGTFSGCESLQSISIPDSVTAIGGSAFSGCKSLKSIAIPDGVTRIDGFAFVACESLESVVIPGTVTEIGNVAFNNGDHIKDVYFLGTKDAWQKVSIESGNEAITEKATMHYFGEWTREKEPTCTETGSETSTCSEADCGKTFTHEIPALGHSWDEGKVTKPATETEDGVKTFTCTRCSVTRTEAIPALSHEHSYKEVVTAPTCTEKGYTTHTCACGDSYVDTYTDPLGHDLKDDAAVAATCTTAGTTAGKHCTRCDYKEGMETIAALGHDLKDDAAVAATCTTAGTTAGKHCTRCDYKEGMETIAALGHDLKDDAAVAATCTTAGTTAGKHCTRCDYKEGMETIAALGHAWDEGKVTKEATETTQGSMTYTCTRCSATKRDILPASGLVATAAYNDVKNDTSWFYPGVQYCLSYGLMSGMGNGSFAPGEYATRAQAAQILYNLHGNPEVSGGTPFTDVPEGAWYQKAVTWAHSAGIVNGVTATTFSPNANITRQDFVLMLMRYLNNVRMVDRTWKPDDLSRFVDAGSVGSWALDAMKDAVAINAISGVTVDGRLYIQPARNATRAEAAKILMMFHETMTK